MDRLAKAAVVTHLIDQMKEQESWCGETHIQKAVYLLQELFAVPTEFDFTLYRHGPFSFDLREELTALRADKLIQLDYVSAEYGPRIVTEPRAAKLRKAYPKTLARHEAATSFVANAIGDRGVSELERLATALWVTRRKRGASVSDRAKEVRNIKPHIPEDLAEEAVKEIDQISAEAKRLHSQA